MSGKYNLDDLVARPVPNLVLPNYRPPVPDVEAFRREYEATFENTAPECPPCGMPIVGRLLVVAGAAALLGVLGACLMTQIGV